MAIEALSEPDILGLIQQFDASTEQFRITTENLRAQIAGQQNELAEKNKLLRQQSRLAALGEMATSVAHEIRNPLGGIQLYVGLLQRKLASSPLNAMSVGSASTRRYWFSARA